MKNFSIKTALVSAAITTTALLSACQKSPEYQYLTGETMGTSYHISYQLPEGTSESAIQKEVDDRLAQINASMSTYIDTATISKFNRLNRNTPITIDPDFSHVLNVSRQVYKQSGGAFDPTVMPLVETWGFGKTMTVDRLQSPPSQVEIDSAKALVDFDAVIHKDNQLYKTKDGVSLDFSAVAKGYGVDVIAEVLKSSHNIRNYMVEIGGEVATSGVNQQLKPWQIAIDAPILDSTVSERQTIASIRQPSSQNNQLHLATSGNYRNSVIFNNQRFSHTIDPATGSPIAGGAPSVTVAAKSVALADAWATALTAMPYRKALETANQQHIAALFIIHDPKKSSDEALNSWQVVETKAMKQLRSDKSP